MVRDREESDIQQPLAKRVKRTLDVGYSSSEEEDVEDVEVEEGVEVKEAEEEVEVEEVAEEVQQKAEQVERPPDTEVVNTSDVQNPATSQTLSLSELEELSEEESSEIVREDQRAFVDILSSLDLDPYTSLDLEWERISQHTDFGLAKTLAMSEMETLFECHLRGKLDHTAGTKTPLNSFVSFLTGVEGRLPKAFTDFNRRQRNDQTYKTLTLDPKTRAQVYARYVKFCAMSTQEQASAIATAKQRAEQNGDGMASLATIELLFEHPV